MCASARLAKVFFLVGAAAVFWLSPGQPARAGDGGGADFASIENFIASICTTLGISSSFCPMVPTISQGVLELAALHDSTPEAVRGVSQFNIPVAPYVDAANPSRPPAIPTATCGPHCDLLNPFTLPINPSVLSTLRPLAFVSATKSNGTATPTQLYDPDANIFFYAVGGMSTTNINNVPSTEPDTLLLFYEDVNRTNQNLKSGQTVASFSLPLTVLNANFTERAVPAVLQFIPPNKSTLDCSASTITGNFLGTTNSSGQPILSTVNPSLLGIGCTVTFGATALSSHSHAVFEISVPLLVTIETDYITVDNPYGFFKGASSNAFPDDDYGVTPNGCPNTNPTTTSYCILGTDPFPSVGIAPSAGPVCTAATCPAKGTPATPTYAFCASLPTNGNGQPPTPSVAAFYAIAGNAAEVLLSAPLAPTGPIMCPSGT